MILLGSTGSIGVSSLQVIEHLTRTGQRPMRVAGLAAGTSVNALIAQAKVFEVGAVAIADVSQQKTLSEQLPGVKIYAGPQAAEELVQQTQADTVVSAIVGVAGLASTMAALSLGRKVCLANKEPLVAAGPLVMPLAHKTGSKLVPIDSEHSAVDQCLAGQPSSRVKQVVLTASGGPFRQASSEQMQSATVEDALKHPTWQMGPKITIDSATMMNKALEIIEAHHLFGLAPEKIDVLIHPESIVHALVEFNDRSIMAQLGSPDMKTPIQYALCGPDRPTGCSEPMDLRRLSQLNFEAPDGDRFPALRLAYVVMEAGGTAGAVFNAANEAAVEAFLNRRIKLTRIVELVREALSAVPTKPLTCLEDVYEADTAARRYVAGAIG